MHYASVQTGKGYCLFIFHVEVMDGLCKKDREERQMEKDRREYLICIRKFQESGTDDLRFSFSITGSRRNDALEWLHNVIIGFP